MFRGFLMDRRALAVIQELWQGAQMAVVVALEGVVSEAVLLRDLGTVKADLAQLNKARWEPVHLSRLCPCPSLPVFGRWRTLSLLTCSVVRQTAVSQLFDLTGLGWLVSLSVCLCVSLSVSACDLWSAPVPVTQLVSRWVSQSVS